MPLLDKIETPQDLRKLSVDELPALCEELRAEIVKTVSQTGGHLASSLGAVEIAVNDFFYGDWLFPRWSIF